MRTTVRGRPVSSVSGIGLTTHYFHDGLGRTTGVTDPRISTENAGVWSNYTKTGYNAQGQVAWTEDTAGNRTTYAYDNPPENPTDAQRLAATGLMTAVEDALGQTVHTHHDPATGRRLAVWGATYPIRYQYDVHGRMTAMHTLRDTTLTIASYQDFLDNAASFDTTAWTYHAATGLLVTKQYADGEQTTYAYTAFGQLARRTWARGVYADYAYNGAANELTAVDYSDATPDVAYAYDRVGRATSVTDAGGSRTFAYNADGTLAAETFGATAYLPGASVARSYDTQGRNVGFQATSFGPGGTTYTVPAATYAYDTYGRLQSVASESETFAYAYGANSPLLATVTFPNGLVTAWTYEATRHLVDHVENAVAGTAVSKYDYSNDTIGRRTGVQKSGTAFTATDTIAWGYDSRSQVTSAVAATDANYDYTYAYDPIGNRTTYVTKETGTPVTTGYTANQLNQYTAITSRTDPAYDDDGNMTLMPAAAGDWTLAWDGENRLAAAESATKRLEFVYDHMDRRIERRTYEGTPGDWTLSETRRFLYDGWHLIAEFNHQSEITDLKCTHLWGLDLSQSVGGAGGVGGLLRTTLYSTSPTGGGTGEGQRYYPTYDANGNVSEYLDSTAAIAAHHEYSPFGKLTVSTGLALPFRFSTKYTDPETRLYYYGYRYYTPGLGRWLNRDPIGERGGSNAHAFVSNSPLSRFDQLGLWPMAAREFSPSHPARQYAESHLINLDCPCRCAVSGGAKYDVDNVVFVGKKKSGRPFAIPTMEQHGDGRSRVMRGWAGKVRSVELSFGASFGGAGDALLNRLLPMDINTTLSYGKSPDAYDNPGCCEVRQYISFNETFIIQGASGPNLPPHFMWNNVFFDELNRTKRIPVSYGDFYEDRDHKGYRYRRVGDLHNPSDDSHYPDVYHFSGGDNVINPLYGGDSRNVFSEYSLKTVVYDICSRDVGGPSPIAVPGTSHFAAINWEKGAIIDLGPDYRGSAHRIMEWY